MTSKMIKPPATADLMDVYEAQAIVLPPVMIHFGGHQQFHGPLILIDCFEDNSRIKQVLATSGLEPQTGQPQVLLVNGYGSLTCALLGDMIAKSAVENQWAGIIIYGCVRDVAILKTLDLGVLALAAILRKSVRQDRGVLHPSEVVIHNQRVPANSYVYVDEDGVVILPEPIHV